MGSIILGAPPPPSRRTAQRQALRVTDEEMARAMNITWRDLIAGEERADGFAWEDRAWAERWDRALAEILSARQEAT